MRSALTLHLCLPHRLRHLISRKVLVLKHRMDKRKRATHLLPRLWTAGPEQWTEKPTRVRRQLPASCSANGSTLSREATTRRGTRRESEAFASLRCGAVTNEARDYIRVALSPARPTAVPSPSLPIPVPLPLPAIPVPSPGHPCPSPLPAPTNMPTKHGQRGAILRSWALGRCTYHKLWLYSGAEGASPGLQA
jgi:hypothetical protein